MHKDSYEVVDRCQQAHWWYQARLEIIMHLFFSYFPEQKKRQDLAVLDVGCGCGLLLHTLENHCTVVEGTDFSSDALRYCRDHFSGRLWQSDLGVDAGLQERYDVIFALDVLEHIENDVTALRNIQNALKPGGIAILTVPSMPWMWSVYDQFSHHFRRYTMKSWHELLQKSELNLDFCSYFNFWLFFPIALIRLVGKLLPPKIDANLFLESKVPPKQLNQLFFQIFMSERERLGAKKTYPFGVSILSVMRKSEE